MNESKQEEVEEGILPRPPAASNNNIVPALPQPLPFRGTDSGVDNENAPPHSSMSPPANEMAVTSTFATTTSTNNTASATRALLGPAEPERKMAVTQTPAPDRPQVDSPSPKNWRRKGKRRARKMLKNRAHRINSRHDDEEIVSTDDYGDFTNPEDDISPSMKPGAVSVGGVATRLGRSSTQQTTSTGQFGGDSVGVTDPGTPFEHPIVAVLVPHGDVVVAAKVEGDDASTFCVLKKRTLILLGILTLLLIIGGVVGGVLSSKTPDDPVVPTSGAMPAPFTLSDPLLGELLLLNATFETDLWRFEDPESPQYQAFVWLKNDTIVMSSGRSTKDLLQRYVLAVLFYSTNGPNWGWSERFLSNDDVCSWNEGSEDHGAYCRLDGESIDELRMPPSSIAGLGLELPRELGLLTNLTMVHLNSLTGTIPTELGQLQSLQDLWIAYNQLTGTLPTELGRLRSLTHLALGHNQLTGTLPTELGQLLSLEHLSLGNNELTGTIPTELGQLLSLIFLVMSSNNVMSSNQLTGRIPSELGQLVSLTNMDLGINQLTGTIPTELGHLESLESLSVVYNQLTGTIPTEFGQLLSVESVSLSNNQLTGTIPTELGQVLSLEYVALSNNQLTGTIPSELAGIANLAIVHFDENSLTGSMEQSFCVESRPSDYYWAVDCDKVECSCCTCK